AGCLDAAISEDRVRIGEGSTVVNRYPADQLSGFTFVKQSVEAGLKLPGVDIIIGRTGGVRRLYMPVGPLDPRPDRALVDFHAVGAVSIIAGLLAGDSTQEVLRCVLAEHRLTRRQRFVPVPVAHTLVQARQAV